MKSVNIWGVVEEDGYTIENNEEPALYAVYRRDPDEFGAELADWAGDFRTLADADLFAAALSKAEDRPITLRMGQPV